MIDYTTMTPTALRERCEQRGIPHEGMTMQEMADALEPGGGQAEVLEAEVIDGEIEHIAYTPAVIDAAAYLEAKRGWIGRMMEPYRDMDDDAIAAMDAKEAKACRADLNRIVKEVDDERKAIKRAYSEPLERFEQAVKELLEPAKRDAARLKEYIDDQERVQRDMRRMGLERTYADFAPALVPVVPFEKLLEMNPKWLNKTYGAARAAQELETLVDRVAKDWVTLQGQKGNLRFYDECEAEFFRSLDLGAALELNRRRVDEQMRIDAMKDEIEANRAASEPELGPEPEPGPAAQPETAPDGLRPMRLAYVIRIDLTPAEKGLLMEYIKDNGIGANRTIGLAVNNV